LKASFDQPSFERVEEGDVHFTGWCFHPDGELTDLNLTLNGTRHVVRFGLDRPDIAKTFPAAAGAARSGFFVSLPLSPGEYAVTLEAKVIGGGSDQFVAPGALVVVPRPLHRAPGLRLSGATGFVGFVLAKARKRVAEGRGWPSWKDISELLRQARNDYRRGARSNPAGRGPAGFNLPRREDPYDVWMAVNSWRPKDDAALRARLKDARDLPLISIVTPVFRPDLKYFSQTAKSVRDQVYTNWEWCLADDASMDQQLTALLEQLATDDVRIRIATRSENGHICRATNSAVDLAHGDFLAFLDDDDLLSPDALAEVGLYLSAHPEVDLLYSDDDKVDMSDRRYAPQFKPDWSPEALLGQMYISHLVVVRRSLFQDVGGLRAGYEGSQDHDLLLRVAERAREVAHLPFVLYHWRATPGSIALAAEAKSYSFDAGLRAVQDASARRGVSATAERPHWAVRASIGVIRLQFPDDGPSVAIVVTNCGQSTPSRRTLMSLALTSYRNYQVVIFDDPNCNPISPETVPWPPDRVLRLVSCGDRRNFAALRNQAARAVASDYLLFLDGDIEVRTREWLSQMMGFGRLTGVGAVGARLLSPSGEIHHAGVLHGLDEGSLVPAFRGLPASDPGYLASAKVCRNYSAVSGACMLTPRALFLELKGLDEENFPGAYHDVDYCFRLVNRGYRCVYAAEAELVLNGDAPRSLRARPEETARFKHRHRQRREPYSNPNLSIDGGAFEVQPRRLVRQRRNKVKASMFTHALDLTGAPWIQLEFTMAMHARGILDPQVISPQDGPLRARYEERGIPVVIQRFGVRQLSSALDYERKIADVARQMAASGADVVYGNTLETFYAIDAARRLGLPSLWNVREGEPWQTCYDYLPEDIASRALGCFAHPYRVVFDSVASRRVFEPLNSHHNFCVIHNGLPPDWEQRGRVWTRAAARQELRLDSSDVAIALIGTVCERKGQEDLVKALALLPSETASRLRCFIVGDRPNEYSRRVAHLMAQLPSGIKNRVQIITETDDVALYYHAADLFVCTSRVESYPRITLEAMACGLPIVSTPVFGLSEQLAEGVNAILYRPADVDALAHAIERLTHDETLRAQMGNMSTLVLAGLPTFDEMVSHLTVLFREAAATG
jgi:glycosyltransferase involved in cell wall biosynthesis